MGWWTGDGAAGAANAADAAATVAAAGAIIKAESMENASTNRILTWNYDIWCIEPIHNYIHNALEDLIIDLNIYITRKNDKERGKEKEAEPRRALCKFSSQRADESLLRENPIWKATRQKY